MEGIKYFLFTFLLLSCQPAYKNIEDNTFKNKFVDLLIKFEHLKNTEKARFKLDTLTDFKWEKMYIFGGSEDKEGMNKRLGFKWEYSFDWDILQEGDFMFVFVRDNQVVSTSYFMRDGLPCNNFSISNGDNFSTPQTSLFYIQKEFYKDDKLNWEFRITNASVK
ncbi:hypothetical protein [Flectobacillus major]|uniref:hypothetical protein n=1 Tax=Flectobacillus major TaxID=103 RepID=UPI000407715F|nr:hypothetical protein [Flectobacillus major]